MRAMMKVNCSNICYEHDFAALLDCICVNEGLAYANLMKFSFCIRTLKGFLTFMEALEELKSSGSCKVKSC